ncbi:MAG: hypothetical protein Q9214_000059 [Letrouitia sp. 1 TL-2023]
MFTTFNAASTSRDDVVSTDPPGTTRQTRQSGQNRPVQTPPSRPSSPSAIRPKRHQVARACDWCRVNRIKCDTDRPCHNCQSRGGQCSNTGKSEVRSLAAATKDIERLKARVQELETELRRQSTHTPLRSSPSSSASPLAVILDPLEEQQRDRRQWGGVWTTGSRPDQPQFSGPSSSSYYLHRLASHMSFVLELPDVDHRMQPNAASRFFAGPTTTRADFSEEDMTAPEGQTACENLSRAQEDYFLGLFWQSYHCTMPILNEADFREHYESLWATPGPIRATSRKPSPLVDIILALCMQYGMTFVPRNDASHAFSAGFDSNDSTIAGRGLYRRCQTLLSGHIENPSILTLQCRIFSAIYLRDASFLNMAHNILAVAIRTAHTLGLHQEPPDHLPQAQRELRRRLWWAVYSLESKACMALGRPWLAEISKVKCHLPTDDHELALVSGPSFTSTLEDITWLTYHIQCVKLTVAARAVHVAFEKKCEQVFNTTGKDTFYGNPQSLETLAAFLSQNLQCIRTWVQNVPDTLKTQRKGGGEPFSIDRSEMEVDLIAPIWLQRQRLLLELLYHCLITNLYRPFICFSNESSSSTPLADGNSISCVNHAIVSTNIIFQVLSSTDVLNGWHEAYQFQWNATLSLVGFLFANPVCPPTPTARKTLDRAIDVFDMFRHNFCVAASATNVTRDLAAKVDSFIDRFRAGSTSSSTSSQQISTMPTPTASGQDPFANNDSAGLGVMPQMDFGDVSLLTQSALSDGKAFGFPVDSFSGFEWNLMDGNGIDGDLWPPMVDG